MKYYREAIQSADFVVRHIRETDEAVEYVMAHQEEIAVILLDWMMPAGKRYEHQETEDGSRTGLFLYGDLRRICPAVPIVILTNVQVSESTGLLQVEPETPIRAKLECTPIDLVDVISKLLDVKQAE